MKIGNKVSVLDEDVQGIVINIKGEKIEIEDDFGFRYWYLEKDLVLKNEALYQEISVPKKEEVSKKYSKKHQQKELKLDLHFDQLVDFPERYDSWERIFIQKEKLMQTLDFCKENGIKKLLIIHGLGDGILQKIVYDILRGYAGIEFEENDFFRHSSASVEVFFRT